MTSVFVAAISVVGPGQTLRFLNPTLDRTCPRCSDRSLTHSHGSHTLPICQFGPGRTTGIVRYQGPFSTRGTRDEASLLPPPGPRVPRPGSGLGGSDDGRRP